MTEPAVSPAPTLNGQGIGQAERATRAVVDVAETDTPFDNWVAINLVASQGEMTERARAERAPAS